MSNFCANQERVYYMTQSISFDNPVVEVDTRFWATINSAQSAITSLLKKERKNNLYRCFRKNGHLYFGYKGV